MAFMNPIAVLTLKETYIDNIFIKYFLDSVTSFSFLIAEAGTINNCCFNTFLLVFYAVVYVN